LIRRHFFLFAALAAVVLMLVVGGMKLAFGQKAGGQGGPAGAGGRATNVSQTVVSTKSFTDRIEVLGVAKGLQSVTITSNTAEMITAVHFADGQTVSRGQVLVDLKSASEDAGIAEAKVRLAQAERDYQRWKTLADRGVAPRATASLPCAVSVSPCEGWMSGPTSNDGAPGRCSCNACRRDCIAATKRS